MHYKNGREAKVGDLVVGKTYNTNGKTIAGTLVSVTPGPDACSAKVGYLETVMVSDAQFSEYNARLVAIQGTQNHGSSGPPAITRYREDYTECKNLLHADDAMAGAEAALAVPQPS